MKKLIVLAFLFSALTSCNLRGKNNDASNEDSLSSKENLTNDKASDPVPCSDETTIQVRAMPDLCTETGQLWSYGMHLIDDAKFKRLYEKKYGSSNVASVDIKWKTVMDIIGTNQCFDKFLMFNFEKNTSDNATIKLQIVDCYSKESDQTCYSIPLFMGINKKLSPPDSANVECTRAINDDGNEIVMFRIKADGNYYNFDISTVPALY